MFNLPMKGYMFFRNRFRSDTPPRAGGSHAEARKCNGWFQGEMCWDQHPHKRVSNTAQTGEKLEKGCLVRQINRLDSGSCLNQVALLLKPFIRCNCNWNCPLLSTLFPLRYFAFKMHLL